MSKRTRKLVENVSNVHQFSDEQLKQSAGGLISMILTGEIDRTTAQLTMSLVIAEAFARQQSTGNTATA